MVDRVRAAWELTVEILTPIFLWVVLPIGAVVVLLYAAPDLRASVQAAQGHGVRGTFVAAQQECRATRAGNDICSWRGRFTGTDGTVLANALLDTDPSSLEVGRSIDATDTGTRDPSEVYLARESREWVWNAFLTVAAGAVLVGWAFQLMVRRRDADRISRRSYRRRQAAGEAWRK